MPERESVSHRVAQKVATLEDTDPTALDPPLHAVVDTEALDGLFRSSDRDETDSRGTVAFDYRGYTVRVDSSGAVRVSESTPTAETKKQPATNSMAD
ncbi:hypothetical protein OB955_11235 [Halobacteria archaeon AArc-m2/3/4]|uniref:Halobacterial output domain-containing protein n=1 Tax=Natronoglomus mannanivorans TaxID=2979990 RepID=A0AAP3E1H3_9EURY|nr:hypothetical protein [Halobacteria archaeon AArc-xg1-1]MCU4973314.1 hypothetical protein [Halobacteria archaeon AArc-m2/3/4]